MYNLYNGFNLLLPSHPLSMITMKQFEDICPAIIFSLLTNNTDCWEGFFNMQTPQGPVAMTTSQSGDSDAHPHEHEHKESGNNTVHENAHESKFKSNLL